MRAEIKLDDKRHLLAYGVHLKSNHGSQDDPEEKKKNIAKRMAGLRIIKEDALKMSQANPGITYEVIVLGDFNTAHRDIDLARPRENRETSGFLPEECAELDRWLAAGWVDTFRAFEPGPDRYTWWSQRFGVRARNVGWRIDYVLASPAAMKFVRGAFIQPEVMGSDHCPLGVDVDWAIVG